MILNEELSFEIFVWNLHCKYDFKYERKLSDSIDKKNVINNLKEICTHKTKKNNILAEKNISLFGKDQVKELFIYLYVLNLGWFENMILNKMRS